MWYFINVIGTETSYDFLGISTNCVLVTGSFWDNNNSSFDSKIGIEFNIFNRFYGLKFNSRAESNFNSKATGLTGGGMQAGVALYVSEIANDE